MSSNKQRVTEERALLFQDSQINYTLERKKVKNINLRVRRDGTVYVSASPQVAAARIDQFVLSKGEFIRQAQSRFAQLAQAEPPPEQYTDEQCRAVFAEIIAEIYPLFQPGSVPFPKLRLRDMKTRWGSCTPAKGAITLNKRLLAKPRGCIEYVIMHEFCHFIQPNHSKHFYALLSQLMPDWQERKRLLNDVNL